VRSEYGRDRRRGTARSYLVLVRFSVRRGRHPSSSIPNPSAARASYQRCRRDSHAFPNSVLSVQHRTCTASVWVIQSSTPSKLH